MTLKRKLAQTDSVKFRKKTVPKMTKDAGIYVICDLDKTPLYVGQSVSTGDRLQRHLTSARCDLIADCRIDPSEMAYIHIHKTTDMSLDEHESTIYWCLTNLGYQLVNSKPPNRLLAKEMKLYPEPNETWQVLPDADIEYQRHPCRRLSRQIEHCKKIADYFAISKTDENIYKAIGFHVKRINKFYNGIVMNPSMFDDDGDMGI